MKRLLKLILFLTGIFFVASVIRKRLSYACPIRNFWEKFLFALKKLSEAVNQEGGAD